MGEINEITIPDGAERLSVEQHGDKIIIKFTPEKPEFNRGDILKSTITPDLTVIFDKMTSIIAFDSIYHNNLQSRHRWSLKKFRHATKEEKQEFFDELEADGKRWNAEKLTVEDIPQPKFKIGDKVRIKDGISSKAHNGVVPHFISTMDEFIGEELTVKWYSNDGYVFLNEDYLGCYFAEDWLEPWGDEPKNGDLAIFWDNSKACALIRIYGRGCHEYHYDSHGTGWENAIKFESIEQFEKILRGEI